MLKWMWVEAFNLFVLVCSLNQNSKLNTGSVGGLYSMVLLPIAQLHIFP